METWREIVAEMRRFGDRHWMHGGQSFREFADRIEKSCKTLEETWRIAIQSAQARHDEEVDALKCENAKLRRALEPVMKCEIYRKVFHVSGGHSLEPNFDWMIDAIGKAQTIMKEGAE